MLIDGALSLSDSSAAAIVELLWSMVDAIDSEYAPEVVNVPAYTGDPLPLQRNYEGLADSYGGADSFLITTETPVEIASDKVKSLISSSAVNPRYRDIWDLGWAARNRIAPDPGLVTKKIQDYGVQDFDTLRNDLLGRLGELINSAPFHHEISRLLL